MLWPWFLAFGVVAFALSWRSSDRRGEWVAGIWCLGIILMQLPVEEPFRWLYAGALWTFAALVVGLMVGAAKVALILALIPVGYWALYFDGQGFVQLDWAKVVAFAVTEIAGVAAVSFGSSKGVRDAWNDLFGRHRRVLGGRGSPSVATNDRRTDSDKRC